MIISLICITEVVRYPGTLKHMA